MFKLVVLCAFFAAAAAKPGVLISAPITQYSTFLSPASTTFTKHESSVIHPSPLFYQAPLTYTHFIKKRSPQFPLAYAAPATYYPNYYAATTYNTPLIHSAPFLSASFSSVPVSAAHLIKKRSAALFPTTYIGHQTYAAASPFIASTYTAGTPIYTHTPLISHPLTYTHLIKKRSADYAYLTPAAYSHQSRFDLQSTPYTSISYANPLTYSSPIAYSSPFAFSPLYKK